jgi:pimeloyl-ACP methyl ester carboxylesterase
VTVERLEVPVPGAVLIGDRVRGDGAAIVLLHAGVCDRRCWRGVIERLAGRDVVAYDRRAFGDVPPPDRPFRHVDDLLAVLDAVSPGAPAWLVGSSQGGEPAVDAALEAPERVAGLVLLAPRVSGEPEPEDEVVIAATHGLAEAIDDAWTSGDQEACNRHEVHLWLDGPAGPEGRVGGPARELAFEMNRIVIANGESEFDGGSGLDAWSRLGEIAVPALVACGGLDVSLKLERSAELARALPAGEYEVLPGRAHLPYLEAPDEVAALISGATSRRTGRREAGNQDP